MTDPVPPPRRLRPEPDDPDAPRGLYASEARDLTQRRSIKVKLPLRHHMRLHSVRLFRGATLSDTVEAALDMYFDHMRQQELAARAAVSAPAASAAGPEAGAAGVS